jgi:hypothetical protein
LDPIRELPYGPAACRTPHRRPDTCQHPTTLLILHKKILLALTGASTHVHDHDVARLQGRDEDLIDIGEEDGAVHSTIIDERRGHAGKAQRPGEGGGLPVAMRHAGPATLAKWGAAPQPRHLGRQSGLINEDEPGRIEIELTIEPSAAALQDVWTVLLQCMCGLF